MNAILRIGSIFGACAVLFSGCASSSVLSTGKGRPATNPEAVKLYTTPPAEFQELGLISGGSNAGMSAKGSEGYAVKSMKKKAAAIGANGILIEVWDARGSWMSWSGFEHSASGKAIWVIRE